MIFTGSGRSGSWAIRGEQLGACMGATLVPKCQKAPREDVIIVKHVEKAPAIGCRTKIWDIVDSWPQPDASRWGKQQAVDFIKKRMRDNNVDHVICATRAMAEDLGMPYWLYHHGRTYAKKNPIREHVKFVAYEGSVKFLGKWDAFIEEECKKRGWIFGKNPQNLTDADIIIAVRDGPFSGYMAEHWKSNVKLANAQSSGTPVILNRECGYEETQSGGEVWADTFHEMGQAFDLLTAQSQRLWRAAKLHAHPYLVEDAANDLREILYVKMGIPRST